MVMIARPSSGAKIKTKIRVFRGSSNRRLGPPVWFARAQPDPGLYRGGAARWQEVPRPTFESVSPKPAPGGAIEMP